LEGVKDYDSVGSGWWYTATNEQIRQDKEGREGNNDNGDAEGKKGRKERQIMPAGFYARGWVGELGLSDDWVSVW